MPIELTPAHLRSPQLDKAAIESGLEEYLFAVRQPWLPPIRWFPDARLAYAYIWRDRTDQWRMRSISPHIYPGAAHRFGASAATAGILNIVWGTARRVAARPQKEHDGSFPL